MIPYFAKAFIVLCLFSCVSSFKKSHFQGKELKACAKLEIPYVNKDSSRAGGFGGLAIDYLHLIAQNLQLKVTLVEWKGTFTALVDKMANCSFAPNSNNPCPCQVAAGAYTVTADRENRVKFVNPFGNEDHVMVSRLSEFQSTPSNFWFIFQTFSSGVWLTIICTIILHAIGTIFFVGVDLNGNVGNNLLEDNLETSHTESGLFSRLYRRIYVQMKKLFHLVLFTYGTFLGHMLNNMGSSRLTLHQVSWFLLSFTSGVFLLTVFQASLTVILFESRSSSPFRSLRDISDCIIDPGRVAMVEGSASQDLWNKAINTSELRNRCSWGLVGQTVDNLTHGFHSVLAGRVAYFYSQEGSVLYWANRNCANFRTVGQPFFSTPVAFMMPNNSDDHLLKDFSEETRKLREQNAFVSGRLAAEPSSCDDVKDATINMQRLGSFFVLYAVLWALLVLWRLLSMWKNRERNTYDGN